MTTRVCHDHNSKPVVSPATDPQLFSVANESSTHNNALSHNCSCWPSWVRSICSQALSHNHAPMWGQVPSQKRLIKILRLDICSLEKSSGLGPWPCRPPLLVFLNKREKNSFRHFWLPKPCCLSLSLKPWISLRPRWELKVCPQKAPLGLSGWKPGFSRGQSAPEMKLPDDAQISMGHALGRPAQWKQQLCIAGRSLKTTTTKKPQNPWSWLASLQRNGTIVVTTLRPGCLD